MKIQINVRRPEPTISTRFTIFVARRTYQLEILSKFERDYQPI